MLPAGLGRVMTLLGRLPGVGEKTASRFALFLASRPELLEQLARELGALAGRVRPCSSCGFIAEVEEPSQEPRCALCADPRRDPRLVCVVARVQDLLAIERSGAMRGRYFVLGRLLSPLDGIGPDELPLGRLRERIAEDDVSEVILATPPSVDGEATALFLARELARQGVTVSRIASGVPHGGDLEFADPITLGRAMERRHAVEGSR